MKPANAQQLAKLLNEAYGPLHNNMNSEITSKLDILAKMFQAMRTRTICLPEYPTTY